jgi:4-hydroxythreonine-4-phosphate dehydrogenase
LRYPVIGITLGDPGGIGPEIILKSLQGGVPSSQVIVFGSRRVLLHHAFLMDIPFPESATIVDRDNVPQPYFGPRPEISGKASIEYLEDAFRYYREGKIQGLVTGPINKASWHAAGYHYPGQTEYCAESSGAREFFMLMAGEVFRIALLSTHMSLQKAISHITSENIVSGIRLVNREFQKLGFDHPRIACAALNPHAGEAGAFGNEEKEAIEPALEILRSEGIDVSGPIAPEIVFRMAARQKPWDVIFALYHDQAMIPLKLVDFESSANVTMGLPLIRTSPDHGTAFDIAGKGLANPASMMYAIRVAVDWTKRRKEPS